MEYQSRELNENLKSLIHLSIDCIFSTREDISAEELQERCNNFLINLEKHINKNVSNEDINFIKKLCNDLVDIRINSKMKLNSNIRNIIFDKICELYDEDKSKSSSDSDSKSNLYSTLNAKSNETSSKSNINFFSLYDLRTFKKR